MIFTIKASWPGYTYNERTKMSKNIPPKIMGLNLIIAPVKTDKRPKRKRISGAGLIPW